MTRRLRALVVDDEPLARQALEILLADVAEVEVVAGVGDGLEAVGTLASEEIDVVFTDIAMPRMTGLALAEHLPEARRPAVVFVTAYADHAVMAFELGVADYVLKPASPERLLTAVRRVIADLQGARPSIHEHLWTGLAPKPIGGPEFLWVDVAGGRQRVHLEEIEVIRAEGDYVRVFTREGGKLSEGPLEKLCIQLESHGFLRVHRSAMVRLAAITQIHYGSAHRLELITLSGQAVGVGRRSTSLVRSKLAGAER